MASDQRIVQASDTPRDSTEARQESRTDVRVRSKLRRLWQPGALFHVTARYPHKRTAAPVDRLAGILRNGLVAPGACADGSVCSDLNIIATGLALPYDRLVFLHRFGPQSAIYTISTPGRFAVFVDPTLAVLTPEELGPKWVILCQDEVYVRESVAVEKLLGVVVHPADADAVLADFLPEFERLEMPLYLYDGTVVWPR